MYVASTSQPQTTSEVKFGGESVLVLYILALALSARYIHTYIYTYDMICMYVSWAFPACFKKKGACLRRCSRVFLVCLSMYVCYFFPIPIHICQRASPRLPSPKLVLLACLLAQTAQYQGIKYSKKIQFSRSASLGFARLRSAALAPSIQRGTPSLSQSLMMSFPPISVAPGDKREVFFVAPFFRGFQQKQRKFKRGGLGTARSRGERI